MSHYFKHKLNPIQRGFSKKPNLQQLIW